MRGGAFRRSMKEKRNHDGSAKSRDPDGLPTGRSDYDGCQAPQDHTVSARFCGCEYSTASEVEVLRRIARQWLEDAREAEYYEKLYAEPERTATNGDDFESCLADGDPYDRCAGR